MHQTYHIEAVENGYVVGYQTGDKIPPKRFAFTTFPELAAFVADRLLLLRLQHLPMKTSHTQTATQPAHRPLLCPPTLSPIRKRPGETDERPRLYTREVAKLEEERSVRFRQLVLGH